MKIGHLVVNLLKHNSYKSALKRRKMYPPYGKYGELIDVPYIDDGNYHHKFDVVYGSGEKKNICIIDIHGGSYIFGEHIDQYVFADYFARYGYDFISADYIPNNGKRSTKDIFDDLYQLFQYIFSHLKELKLENDKFVITGDSAGGHLALSFAEAMCDKEYAKELGYEFPEGFKLYACLANCPVYDYVNISKDHLLRSGQKRLFGPEYKDEEKFKLLCPKVHIDSLTCPTFVSTCSQDFLRGHSLDIANDMKDRDVPFELMDLYSETKGIAHVHNVLHPFKKESAEVNDAMIRFIEKNVK